MSNQAGYMFDPQLASQAMKEVIRERSTDEYIKDIQSVQESIHSGLEEIRKKLSIVCCEVNMDGAVNPLERQLEPSTQLSMLLTVTCEREREVLKHVHKILNEIRL